MEASPVCPEPLNRLSGSFCKFVLQLRFYCD
jgi:hypothetical protein